jgi:formamidopyrimidine-DNA glycosylase
LELPEIFILSRDLGNELSGKLVSEVNVKNAKCLNLSLDEFRSIVVDRRILGAKPRGKWVFLKLTYDYILLNNTGMGTNTIYNQKDSPPEEVWHIKSSFDDGSGFTSRVWWFCYLHLVKNSDLKDHKMTARLGSTPLYDVFTKDYLNNLLAA